MRIDQNAIGVEVSWSFGAGRATDVRVSREDMAGFLESNGFDGDRVPDGNLKDTLKRALQMSNKSQTFMLRKLANPNKDTWAAYGAYFRREGDETGDKWVMGARVRVEKGQAVALPPDGGRPFDDLCLGHALRMANAANDMVSHLYNTDISVILTDLGDDLGWINRRRNGGGVYLLPNNEATARFLDLLMDIHQVTKDGPPHTRFYPEVVEMFSKPATMATLKEVTIESFESRIEKLVRDLIKLTDDDCAMRESTMDKRAEEAGDLIEQAKRYKAFLDDAAGQIEERLDKIRDRFTRQNATVKAHLAEIRALAPNLEMREQDKDQQLEDEKARLKAAVERFAESDELFADFDSSNE